MIRLFDLLKVLSESDLRFMVIGGMAAVLHGATTATRDLDVSISMKADELKKLRNCLKDLRPTHRMNPKEISFLTHPESLEGLNNVYLRTDFGILDIIGDLSSVGSFEDLYSRSEIVRFQNRDLRVIALPDLIQMKKTLGRDKDLLAVKELEVILAARQ